MAIGQYNTITLLHIKLQKYEEINKNQTSNTANSVLNIVCFEIIRHKIVMLKLWFPSDTLDLPSFYTSPSLQRLRSFPFAYLQFSGLMTSEIPCIQELLLYIPYRRQQHSKQITHVVTHCNQNTDKTTTTPSSIPPEMALFQLQYNH